MNPVTIYTLDAREHVLLETMTNHLKLTTAQVYKEINNQLLELKEVLKEKGLAYEDVKNALVPQTNRNEVGFVFDSNIAGTSYGDVVFDKLIPLLDKNSTTSILCGDYIGGNRHFSLLKHLFFAAIETHIEIDYKYHDQFFIVYLNNLSDEQFQLLREGLKSLPAFVGYFDLSYASPLKTIISGMLVRAYVKCKKTVINAAEGNEDVNMRGYAFEKSGYRVIGVDDINYGLFLSYKIEREIFPGFEADGNFSINAISENVFEITDFSLLIEEPKLGYLKENKSGSMGRVGFDKFSTEELSDAIGRKIKDNYIYNLTYLPEHGTLKFNIIIEVLRTDKNKPMKMLVSLEYMPEKKTLRLLTMF